jgi:hypothetical protein
MYYYAFYLVQGTEKRISLISKTSWTGQGSTVMNLSLKIWKTIYVFVSGRVIVSVQIHVREKVFTRLLDVPISWDLFVVASYSLLVCVVAESSYFGHQMFKWASELQVPGGSHDLDPSEIQN